MLIETKQAQDFNFRCKNIYIYIYIMLINLKQETNKRILQMLAIAIPFPLLVSKEK